MPRIHAPRHRALAPVPLAALLAALLAPAASATASAQPEGYDDLLVALAYHKASGQPVDLRRAAEASAVARRASSFDRPDMVRQEMARLQGLLDAAGPHQEFTLRVGDHVSDYDHGSGEFSVNLFTPGVYVQVAALGQSYQLVFANAESARPIPMPKERARDFDLELGRSGRAVTNEVRFRVVGRGDPAGAVTGPHVIRAELLESRLLDRAGRVVWAPTVAPAAAVLAAAPGAAPGAAGAAAFDATAADVAGFRVGVPADDLEATLRRLFGPVTRAPARRDGHPGIVARLVVNDMGCTSLPGRRANAAAPGSVCVTAFVDGDDVVRGIRVERVFPWMDAETFRRTLVARYGPVADARGGGRPSLGWGPEVPETLAYDRSGPRTALTAHYDANDDFMARALSSRTDVRVVLQLVDARWAAGAGR